MEIIRMVQNMTIVRQNLGTHTSTSSVASMMVMAMQMPSNLPVLRAILLNGWMMIMMVMVIIRMALHPTCALALTPRRKVMLIRMAVICLNWIPITMVYPTSLTIAPMSRKEMMDIRMAAL